MMSRFSGPNSNPPRGIPAAAFWLLLGLCAAPAAHAKGNSWWDCFFREFELCQGRTEDPDAPAPSNTTAGKQGQKSYCDGAARNTCDQEELANTLKLGGAGANSAKAAAKSGGGPGKSSTIQLSAEAGNQTGGVPAVPEETVVEGAAPSGDKTVLGVDVTLSIAEVAEGYTARNVRGCRAIEDLYTRVLCLDAPGAAGGAPIELEFYRGRLVSLRYEPKGAVKFRAAVAVAEEKTGGKAALTSYAPELGRGPAAEHNPGRLCRARFALGGGTLTLQGNSPDDFADPCATPYADAAPLGRVEWMPSAAVRRVVANQRKADHPGAKLRNEEVLKTRELLPL